MRECDLHSGARVKIDGGCADADGDVRGRTGRIVGDNHTQRGPDGVLRTMIETVDGKGNREHLAVPTKALKKDGR